jgi:hypothetical protein
MIIHCIGLEGLKKKVAMPSYYMVFTDLPDSLVLLLQLFIEL